MGPLRNLGGQKSLQRRNLKNEQEIFSEEAEIGVPGRQGSVSELKGKAESMVHYTGVCVCVCVCMHKFYF